jgi:OOP family OmpA-OmpF porin
MVQQGINSKRLQTKGYGELRPKLSNENPETRQLNRRVEIKALRFIDQME